jgi:hypothetical protein
VPELLLADPAERDDLGAFVARAVRLDGQAVVRLQARTAGADSAEIVDAWVATPFDALATRSVAGSLRPADVTVSGNELLAGLAVVGGEHIDPGPARDLLWRSALPPLYGWHHVEDVPAEVLTELADRGVAVAREHAGPHGTPPASLLDQQVITASGGGFDVKVPLRCLFALSGMGFLGPAGSADTGGEVVRVTATDAWLRLDAHYGAVVRRRHAMLPLLT